MERVPNEKFREEFLRNPDITAKQVCEAVGWMRMKPARSGEMIQCTDATRVKRAFGIMSNGNTYQDTIPYDVAVKLLDLFCFDPVDVGV